jgi:hypothetical protein
MRDKRTIPAAGNAIHFHLAAREGEVPIDSIFDLIVFA